MEILDSSEPPPRMIKDSSSASDKLKELNGNPKKRSPAAASDSGEKRFATKICHLSHFPDLRTREYKDYLDELNMTDGYGVTSTFGSKIPGGVCPVTKDDLRNPKLMKILHFVIAEHNKHCQGHGGSLRLVGPVQVNYEITCDGTYYYVTLEAKNRKYSNMIFQAGVFACEQGCMILSKFHPFSNTSHEIFEIRNRIKISSEEFDRLNRFEDDFAEKTMKFYAILEDFMAKNRRKGEFDVVDVCDSPYVTKDCDHWRPEWDDCCQRLSLKPYHLTGGRDSSDASPKNTGDLCSDAPIQKIGTPKLRRRRVEGLSKVYQDKRSNASAAASVSDAPIQKIGTPKLRRRRVKGLSKVYQDKRSSASAAASVSGLLDGSIMKTRNSSYVRSRQLA